MFSVECYLLTVARCALSGVGCLRDARWRCRLCVLLCVAGSLLLRVEWCLLLCVALCALCVGFVRWVSFDFVCCLLFVVVFSLVVGCWLVDAGCWLLVVRC